MINLFDSLFYHGSVKYAGKKQLVSFIESQYLKSPTRKPTFWQEDVHTSIVYGDFSIGKVALGDFSNSADYFRESSIPQDLVAEIDSVLQNFVQSKKLNEIGKFHITEMWYNAYKNRQYQRMHKHSNSKDMFFSGVYYMKFDKQTHSATRFYNPHFEIDFHNPFVNQHPLFVCTPSVEEDDVLIFPSNFGHDVLPQDSDKLRITVAFNVSCVFHKPQYAYS